MLKPILKLVIALTALLIGNPSHAVTEKEKRYYVSIGYLGGTLQRTDEHELFPAGTNRFQYAPYRGGYESLSQETTKTDIQSPLIKLGYQITLNSAIEIRYGGGGAKDTTETNIALNSSDASINSNLAEDPKIQNPVTAHTETEIDQLYGIYFRSGKKTEKWYPYGILGVTSARMNTTLQNIMITLDNPNFHMPIRSLPDTVTREIPITVNDGRMTSVSYGIGLDYDIHKNTAINLEYMSYIDNKEAKMRGISISLHHRF